MFKSKKDNLMAQISNKVEEVKKLTADGDIDGAIEAKAELINLQKEYDKEKEKSNKIPDNLKVITSNGVSSMSGTGLILNKGDKVADYINKEEDSSNLDLGRYIKGALTGDWTGAGVELERFKALTTGTGQILIPVELSADIIDLARNKSVIFNGGVPMINMTSNTLTIGKVLSDPKFEFKKEGETASVSEMSFEGVTLKSKTAYGLMSITLELLHSAQNLSAIIQNSMAESIANMIDYACLFGDGGEKEPLGILNNENINTIQSTGLGYSDFVKAVGSIRKNNGEPTTMVINADVDEYLNLLSDKDGNPLIIPKVVEGLQREISNQLPNNEGASNNESTSMVFDPMSCLIGMQVPIAIEVSRELGFSDGTIKMRVYSMLDIAAVRPKNITKITKQITQ